MCIRDRVEGGRARYTFALLHKRVFFTHRSFEIFVHTCYNTCLLYTSLTIEAGRPDTIDEEKLRVLRAHNTTRVSINPQTMEDRCV